MSIWDPRKKKLDTVLRLVSEEVRRHPISSLVPVGGPPDSSYGSCWWLGQAPLWGHLASLPSHPQFWLCLVWQSVCVCLFVSVLWCNHLIVALCFTFGETGQALSARHLPLDLVLACSWISRNKVVELRTKTENVTQPLEHCPLSTALWALSLEHCPCSIAPWARSPAQSLHIWFWLFLNVCLCCGLYVLVVDFWLRSYLVWLRICNICYKNLKFRVGTALNNKTRHDLTKEKGLLR